MDKKDIEGTQPPADGEGAAKRITRSDLNAMIGDAVEAKIGDAFSKAMERLDSSFSEKLKPITEQVTTQSERLVDMERRKARLMGDASMVADLDQLRKDVAKPNDGLDPNKFSFVRYASAYVTGDWTRAPLERDMIQKAMSLGTDSAGGYLVPTLDLPEEFIAKLDSEIVCIAAGCEVWDNLRGSPVNVPKETAGTTTYYPGENTAITASQPTIGELQLTPKEIAGLVQMSKLLVKNNAVAVEAYIRGRLAKDLGLGIDLACLRGTGTNNQPTGIANTSNINTKAIATNGGEFTPVIAKAMRKELAIDSVPDANRVWIMNGRMWEVMDEQIVASETHNYALNRDVSAGTPRRLLGYPVFISNQIPQTLTKGTNTDCSEIYLGVIDTLVLGRWGTMDLEATGQGGDSFAAHQIWVKAVATFDVGVKIPTCWCLCSDARDA